MTTKSILILSLGFASLSALADDEILDHPVADLYALTAPATVQSYAKEGVTVDPKDFDAVPMNTFVYAIDAKSVRVEFGYASGYLVPDGDVPDYCTATLVVTEDAASVSDVECSPYD